MVGAMSWIDPLLALLVAGLAALGASRRLTGLWVGVGGLLLLRPFLLLSQATPVVALILALLAGLLLGLLGRNLMPSLRTGVAWQQAAGAIGGGLLGVALVLTMVTSLPIQRSPFDPNQLFYPPRDLPAGIQGPVQGSWTVRLGRDILLHPLLEAQGSVPEGRLAALRGLHRWLVVGEPWRPREGAEGRI